MDERARVSIRQASTELFKRSLGGYSGSCDWLLGAGSTATKVSLLVSRLAWTMRTERTMKRWDLPEFLGTQTNVKSVWHA